MHESSSRAEEDLKPPTSLAIRNLRCPKCDAKFEQNCEGLMNETICPECGALVPYAYGYLNYYKEYIEIFMDPVHALPLVPGYSTSGRVMSLPDDLLVVDFGMTYNKPPEVFFLYDNEGSGKSARQIMRDNQVLLPLSIVEDNFILFSRSLDKTRKARATPLTWVAIGETGEWERPLWLNYLQNAADLVRKQEDIAAIVMLMMALDFFYDHILERLGIPYDIIRRKGRRPGMNEKRAKLKFISERLGDWPRGFAEELTLLTEYRNQIVHGQIKEGNIKSFNARRAFQIVLRAVLFLIEMLYNPHTKSEGSA
jgi:hypothetical protein